MSTDGITNDVAAPETPKRGRPAKPAAKTRRNFSVELAASQASAVCREAEVSMACKLIRKAIEQNPGAPVTLLEMAMELLEAK